MSSGMAAKLTASGRGARSDLDGNIEVTSKEAADMLNVSERTVRRRW